MALIIYTNTAASNVINSLDLNSRNLERASKNLSTGKRINSAKDGAAELGIISKMKKDIDGLNIGNKNSKDALAVLGMMDSSLMGQIDVLSRMRLLAVSASNGIYSSSQLSNVNTEFEDLISEVARYAEVTTFNDTALLTAAGSINIQVGPSTGSANIIAFNTYAASSTDLSIDSLSVASASSAATAIGAIDDAIDDLNGHLAEVGAFETRFDFANKQGIGRVDGLSSALSNVQDADMAKEAADLSRSQILQQVGISMLAIANAQPKLVLELIR